MTDVHLRAGREHPFRGRHPWVFSGALQDAPDVPTDGSEVRVLAGDGSFVARGLYNGRSQIRVRLYRWEDRPLDRTFLRHRVLNAVDLRARLGLLGPEGAVRLIFSEGDGLSGLIVDRYGEWLSVQVTSLALHARLDVLLDALEERLRPRGIVLRTEKGILEEEGLELRDGPIRGEEPSGPVTIVENGLKYRVELRTGQKTGFFVDQRDNRMAAARYGAGRRVADVCCYTGGFSLPLLDAGAASLVGVDVSAPAIELARVNLMANRPGDAGREDRVRFVQADAFRWLEGELDSARSYDMIVLDPPRFARSQRGVPNALRGYRRLNELAVRCIEPGGILVTCSCTGRVDREAFQGVLGEVEVATGRRIRILDARGQPPDHPVSPTCPETAYLKCLICSVA